MLRCFAALFARTAVTWIRDRLSKSAKKSEIKTFDYTKAVLDNMALPLFLPGEVTS